MTVIIGTVFVSIALKMKPLLGSLRSQGDSVSGLSLPPAVTMPWLRSTWSGPSMCRIGTVKQ